MAQNQQNNHTECFIGCAAIYLFSYLVDTLGDVTFFNMFYLQIMNFLYPYNICCCSPKVPECKFNTDEGIIFPINTG